MIRPVVGWLVLLLAPIVTFSIVGGWLDGLGIPIDLALFWVVLLWMGARLQRGMSASVVVGALWALAGSYGLALAGSRMATDAELPLYDLALLLRPLVVVGADLYGAVVYALALLALLLPLALWGVGGWLARGAGRLDVRWALVICVGLALLPGSRFLLVDLGSDVVRSWRMSGDFDAERRSRPHDDLDALSLPASPDVHIYVVESYGDVIRTLARSELWASTVRTLDEQVQSNGWHTASALSAAPVHGGRSWIADASVLTGLYVDSQSNYERVTARADRLVTMPGFFADRGYRTILVRPADRERPGVRLQNRFSFQHTVFFEDLNYTGPVLGWGHIPDQYTLHVTHRDVIDPGDEPTFAFFHLATSHMPWVESPVLVPDPMALLTKSGGRTSIIRERTAYQQLRIQMKRFAGGDGTTDDDRMRQQSAYVASVVYDLRAIVRQVVLSPSDRPRLVVFYGDHQPPFLARGEGPNVPVHVMATDSAMLEPFLEQGFRPGLFPEYPNAAIAHRDLFPLVADAAAQAR